MDSILKGNVIPSGIGCNQIPQDSLIASYLLQGTAESETGSFNGTEANVTYSYDDEKGIVPVFDGNDSITISPAIPITSQMSISLWFNHSTTPINADNETIFETTKYSSEVLAISLRATTNSVRVFIRDSVAQSALYDHTSVAINDGLWHHYAVLFDDYGNTLIYLDGALVHTLDTSALSGPYAPTDTVFGKYAFGALDYLYASMSNVHIYNRVLTADEVSTIYNLEKYQHNNPLDHGLIAYYPLDGNSLDNAINQYDGTDTSVSYVADPTFGIVLDCGAGNVGLPTAIGHARTYYWENTGSGWVHNNTATEITSLTTNKYAHVRKYNRTLSDKELSILQDVEYGLLCPEGSTINNPDPFEDGSGIALYKLDGNANDTTGVYNGTPTNVTYTNGEFGQSAVFNGSTSYITVPTGIITATDVFTVAIWFKTTLSGTAEYMVYNALDAEYVLWIDANNKLAGGVYASGWSLPVSVNTYNDGNWHLAILQYDRTTTTLNVDNGAEVITDTGATGDMRALARHSLIGAGTSGSIIGHWNGNLDQARFFDRVLTADEITKLYNERKV